MKSVIMLCAGLLICVASVAWAADEPGKPAVAPEPVVKMAPGTAKLMGEPMVMEYPASKAAAAMEKAADFAPEGGYTKDQAGVSKAYAGMMKDGFDKLMKWSHATGTWPSGPAFAVYFEDPSTVEPAKLTAKVCFPVPPDAKPAEGVTIEEFPAMSAVMLQYQGPYQNANNAWATLMDWTAKNGYVMAGPPMEVYLKGQMDVKDPKDYLTEIRFPVKKAEMKKTEETPQPKE